MGSCHQVHLSQSVESCGITQVHGCQEHLTFLVILAVS